jgi:hypothetical protein
MDEENPTVEGRMRKYYVIFRDERVRVVLAKSFGLWLISPLIGTLTQSVQTYAFYDEQGTIVGQFFYDDVRCITNENPEVR